MKRYLRIIALSLSILVAVLVALAWVSTDHPKPAEDVAVASRSAAPELAPGQRLKIMSWNVQYLAGKGRVFFYDLPGGDGPDERPSSSEISQTLRDVARVIIDEDPDVVLLQEVDRGSRRTDRRDQLAELLALLPRDYACWAQAYYHRAWFVPHPRIMGSVGLTVAVISKYRIARAVRRQLPLMPGDPVTRLFNFKRCVLEARLPVAGGGEFSVMSTHLDAFAQGGNTMERQVAAVLELLKTLDDAGVPWAVGGDFNLLPPGGAYARLAAPQQAYFNPRTEIEPLFARYRSVPSLLEANGGQRQSWFTHFPNDPAVAGPDRTIDYLFLADQVGLGAHHVRQSDCMTISDHFPLVAEIALPEVGQKPPKGKSGDIGSSLLP